MSGGVPMVSGIESWAEAGDRRWPRITVVTPAYNSADLIEDCIASVLDQGYPNLEYIVVDGGSTDGTVEVVRRYEDRLAPGRASPTTGRRTPSTRGSAARRASSSAG